GGENELQGRGQAGGDLGVDQDPVDVHAPVALKESEEVLDELRRERLTVLGVAVGEGGGVGVREPLVAEAGEAKVGDDEGQDDDAEENGDKLEQTLQDEDDEVAETPAHSHLPCNG